MSAAWPTWTQKRTTMRHLRATLFPAQDEASRFLTGPRTVPSVVQVIGGERAGKSQWTAYETVMLMPWCDLIFLCGLEYDNTRREFEYVEEALRKLGALKSVNKPRRAQWEMISATGCRIATLSFTRGVDAIITTGLAPDLVVLCEAGLLDLEHFNAAYARVAEKRGAVIMAGTLKRAKPWYVALYRELQTDANPYHGRSFSFPSWENQTVYPRGRADETIKAMEQALGDLVFRERFGAEPVPSPLLVFGHEFAYATHVKHVDYDPDLPLWIAVDPGYAGAYAVLIVQAASASDVRVIDEFYRQYATWDEAVAWLRERPYVHQNEKGRILNIERAVMDIAGTQHHGDKSQVERWRDTTGINFLCQPVPIETGISRLRDFLRSPFNGKPRIAIAPRCEGLLWELTEGEQYPKDSAGNPVKEAPVDANNHARKALSYLLVNAFGVSDFSQPLTVKPGANPFARAAAQRVELVRTGRGIAWSKGRKRSVVKGGLSFGPKTE